MKKVIVTGGLGFIGSHTVIALYEAGYTPVIIDNLSNSDLSVLTGLELIMGQKPEFHFGDCRSKVQLDKVFSSSEQVCGVIHFAAFKSVGESVRQPLKYYENNILSTLHVLEMMSKYKVPVLVFSSSCTVYGQPKDLPVTEDSPLLVANSPYGYTKQVCEQIIADFLTADNDKSAVILRYFNPIGAHSSAFIGELPLGIPENLVPFITRTAIGLLPELRIFGDDWNTPDGTCIRDYIHVCDLAEAHVKALEKAICPSGIPLVYNLGSGKGVSVLSMVRSFERVNGVKVKHCIAGRRPGDVEKIYSSCSKANVELKWACSRSIDNALRDAWKWELKLSAAKA